MISTSTARLPLGFFLENIFDVHDTNKINTSRENFPHTLAECHRMHVDNTANAQSKTIKGCKSCFSKKIHQQVYLSFELHGNNSDKKSFIIDTD